MSTSKQVKNEITGNLERPGDPEGDFDYLFPPASGPITITSKEKLRRKQQKNVEKFKAGNLGFVPDSRRALSIALHDVNDQIEAIYTGVRHKKPTSAVGEFYEKDIKDRKERTEHDVSCLSDANSSIDYTDERTFSVAALRSSYAAMKTLALFRIKQYALIEGDWSRLDSDKVETNVRYSLHDMSGLPDAELSSSWHEAWESSQNELTFWTRMDNDARRNPRVRSHLGIEDETGAEVF